MYGLIPRPRHPGLKAPFTMDPVQGLPTDYQPRPLGDSMHHPLVPYESKYGQTGTDLERAQAELELLAAEAEGIARGAGAEVSSAVSATRDYAQHRQFLYMFGAPAIVLAGLSNRRYPLLGLFAAAVGAYVGVKNYQEHREAGGEYGQMLVLPPPGRPVPPASDPWSTAPGHDTLAFKMWKHRKLQTDPDYYGSAMEESHRSGW